MRHGGEGDEAWIMARIVIHIKDEKSGADVRRMFISET